MPLFRWILGLPFAALVTTGLFLMMSQLIKERQSEYPPPQPSPKIQITPDPHPDGPIKVKPPSETLPKKIPETELDFPKSERTPKGVLTVPAKTPTPTTPPGQTTMGGPVIRIPPPYPENCRSRGAEGVVIVEFDVSPEGNVINPRIVQTANRCFERTVLKSVSGWKYPPAGNGGMRYGVIEQFYFQLED